MQYTPYSANLGLSKLAIVDVRISGHKQRLTWIRTIGLSVSLLVSQEVNEDGRLGTSFLIASLQVDEGKEQVKAICRDYVRRQNDLALEPIPMRKIRPVDLKPDEQMEFDATGGRVFIKASH